MSIYAGLATRSGYDEGGSDTATFATPLGIAVDQSGNVFVGDQNGLVIRKIDTGQVVSTYAGSSTSGNADGTLLSATFSLISSITSLPTRELMVIDGKASLIRRIGVSNLKGMTSNSKSTPRTPSSDEKEASAAAAAATVKRSSSL